MKKFVIAIAALGVVFTAVIINSIYMNTTLERMYSKITENDLEGYREILEKNMKYFNTVCQKEHVEEVKDGLASAEYFMENGNNPEVSEELRLSTEKLGSYEIWRFTNIL